MIRGKDTLQPAQQNNSQAIAWCALWRRLLSHRSNDQSEKNDLGEDRTLSPECKEQFNARSDNGNRENRESFHH